MHSREQLHTLVSYLQVGYPPGRRKTTGTILGTLGVDYVELQPTSQALDEIVETENNRTWRNDELQKTYEISTTTDLNPRGF